MIIFKNIKEVMLVDDDKLLKMINTGFQLMDSYNKLPKEAIQNVNLFRVHMTDVKNDEKLKPYISFSSFEGITFDDLYNLMIENDFDSFIRHSEIVFKKENDKFIFAEMWVTE